MINIFKREKKIAGAGAELKTRKMGEGGRKPNKLVIYIYIYIKYTYIFLSLFT